MKIAIINSSWPAYNLATDRMMTKFKSEGHEVELFNRANMWAKQCDKAYLSAIFTWHLPELCQDILNLKDAGVEVEVGGPAATAMSSYIIDKTGLQPHLGLDERFEHVPGDHYQMIFTSRGCLRKCLPAGELVSMFDGSQKPIEKLCMEDRVKSIDVNGNINISCVSALLITPAKCDIFKITTNDGVLCCTPDHLVFSIGGWCEAGKLKVGDYIGKTREIYHDERWDSEIRISKNKISPLQGWQKKYVSTGIRSLASESFNKQSNEKSSHHREESTISISQRSRQGTCSAANVFKQSYVQTRNSREDVSFHEKIYTEAKRTNASAHSIGENGWTNVNRGTQKSQRKNETGQSDEKFSHPTESSINSPMENVLGSEELFDKMGTKNRTKQNRSSIRAFLGSPRFSFCRRWNILDRTMPKREMPQPRLYLEEWQKQNSATLQFRLLAQSTKGRRCRNDEGLQIQELGGILDDRGYDKEFTCDSQHGHGMVSYSKIISIEKCNTDIVYDIETKPDHNFIASGFIVHNCSWCIVSKVEPVRVEYSDFPIPVGKNPFIGDNCVLATSWEHQKLIVEKMKNVRSLDINSGFDCRLFEEEHYQLYSKLHLEAWRFAFDSMGVEKEFERAVAILKNHNIGYRKILVYNLIGYPGTTFEECVYRLEKTRELGCSPYPQKYAPLDTVDARAYVAPGFEKDKLDMLRTYWCNPFAWRTCTWEDFKAKYTPDRDMPKLFVL